MCFGLFFAFFPLEQAADAIWLCRGRGGRRGKGFNGGSGCNAVTVSRSVCLPHSHLSLFLSLPLSLPLSPSLFLSLLLPTATGFTLPHALATQGWGDVALVVAAAAAALIGLCAFSFTHFRMRLANWWRAMPVAEKPDRQLKSWKATGEKRCQSRSSWTAPGRR